MFRVAVALILVVLLLPVQGFGQELSLSGTVRDSSGVVPGATVVLSSVGKDVAKTTTDGAGVYRFDRVSPGTYQVAVSLRGFETAVRNVAIGSAPPVPVDVVLSVGRVSTTLTITASGGRATASRLPVADDAIPAQLISVPQELMRQQATNTVADALKNVSGVQAVRWYGAYEQYSIRGFFDPDRDVFNVVLVDGMRRGGNRYGTQTNNLQSVDVLKGPASILYGRGAVGGVINLVRKKPEATRGYEASYRAGRFNTHQVAAGATGTVVSSTSFLYRVDASFEGSDGWRGAGADRLSISPSFTWAASDRVRLAVQQDFNRDRFDGDGGVPLNITALPTFRREVRFSLPQDNVLVEDSQTQVFFDASLSRRWQLRNEFSAQRTSDRYFVTEGVYGDPDANLVYREPLDFHHERRPIQNQTELVGTLNGSVRHTVVVGYEYQRDRYRTDVTAGDDPDCVCGYWWLTIAPMDLTTLVETQPPLDLDTITRQTFVTDEIHALYWQDQIEVLPQVKVNVGGRFDDYARRVTRAGGLPFTPQARDQTAYSYRAGVVYAPRVDQQLYFGASSSFSPVTTIPADGSELDPSTARNYEMGHRWQGLNGRVSTNIAAYYVVRNNLSVRESVTTVVQIGEQTSQGLDVDVNAQLGADVNLIASLGLTRPRFADAEDLTGKTPRYVPTHVASLWLRKTWRSGLNVSLGARLVGEQFADNANTTRIDGFTIVSGAVGYRANRWEWSLNVENLLNNQDYFLPGHFNNLVFPGPPISATNTIRLRF